MAPQAGGVSGVISATPLGFDTTEGIADAQAVVAFFFLMDPRSQVPILKSRAGRAEVSHARTERFYLKLSLGSLAGLILLIALIWGGRNLYVRWQERRLTRQALVALERGDQRTASLAARNVLELKPASVPAARVMAELAEQTGNRMALDWRRRVTDLQPDSVEDKLAWARCALQFNDPTLAERALSSIEEAGRHNAGYHAVGALLAQARGQDEQADREWTKALEPAPGEKSYQLQLGILRLRATNEDRHASGKAMLTLLRADPKYRGSATRALINDGITRQEDAQQLLELARELQAYPDATLSDRLLFLGFLRQLQNAEFTKYLTDLEKSAAEKPTDLAGLLAWMSQNNLNLLALDFVKSVSVETTGKWPVPLAVADIYTRLSEWRNLEDATKSANWQQLDYLRHAYLARSFREQDKTVAAEREWSIAAKAAAAQSEYLLSLARTAAEWNWNKEALDLLWQLSKNADAQSEALHTLYLHYAKVGDTQGVYRVLLRLFEMNPADLKVQNNLAQIALLLDADLDRARKLAVDLYRKEGSNPTFAATYAYSLYEKGDAKGAAGIMAALNEQQLSDPSVAAYYGVFLVAVGQKAEAKKYLDLGATANLLPEEKALVEKAQKEIATGN